MTEVSGFQLKRGGPEVYEASWVRAQMGRAAEDLVAAVNVAPGDRVIDVGCGTGVVARTAAELTGSAADVIGTDVSAEMVEAAAKFAAEAGYPDIVWLECDAAAIPLPDATFDVVLCQQGLQFMPDKPGAMAEMARVMKPGGRLALSVWKARSPIGAAFSTVLDREFGEGTTAPWDMVYSLGDRNRLHDLAAGAGLREAYVSFDVKFARHPSPTNFITGAIAGSPIAGTIEKLPVSEHDRLIREILEELAEFQDDYGLAVPAQCLTLTARR
ncbi:class I SAM-dependent methyltransferase [Ovoidimarina sediminis]|uniref:class I SAM-dependent methyltransferase n=1 Tax=Ovoidimarina sediminis TaxID=3079856 RepID=UPI002911B4E9|nr:methyltransferase domain-containing protein [Rhodophyticola sp. MJ-SS7]MDU8946753.1 methyltransferase domain-containing protein [Rhodophyticola sp. MJ-SS7]